MEVLMFDHEYGGHHLEYLANFSNVLDEFEDVSVRFLLPSDAPGVSRYLDTNAVTFLFDDNSPTRDRMETVHEALLYVVDSAVDVIHFVHLDDVLADLYHGPVDASKLPPFVGHLNGNFFNRGHPRLDAIIERWPLGPRAMQVAHRAASTVTAVPGSPVTIPGTKATYLYLCLSRGYFDHLFVHTDQAKRYVESLAPSRASSVSVVPDPVRGSFGGSPTVSPPNIDINGDDPVVLFFGETRYEKGADILLDAVADYMGPEFTLVVAGEPVDVTEEDVEAARRNPRVRVVSDLRFVPEEFVPGYFTAADAVAIPYRKTFGAERTSGVFQKACATNTPVIAPDFGELGTLTDRHNLGVTFRTESVTDLARTVESVIRAPTKCYDRHSMRRYLEGQTFERLGDLVVAQYRDFDTPLDAVGPSGTGE